MLEQDWMGDAIEAILAVSGGADSVYLLALSRRRKPPRILVAHFNHGARGRESESDQRFVENLCKAWGIPMEVGRAKSGNAVSLLSRKKGEFPPRFEEKAREDRFGFLKRMKRKHRAARILVAHTADDQVETVLMRILEGAGLTGLKGIPRFTEDGIERPLLDTWREDILNYLNRHKIPYRVDKSNFDTRFERNWVRHELFPFLETRYGKSLKKRIFTLGERFRELDAFVEDNACKWLHDNMIYEEKRSERKGVEIPRKAYSGLPSVLRIRILQRLLFERLGTVPNERLLLSMDRTIVSGGPSARLSIGRGAVLRCRYGIAVLSPMVREKTSRDAAVRSGGTGKREKRQPGSGGKESGDAGNKGEGRGQVVRVDGPGVYRWTPLDPAKRDSFFPTPPAARTFRWEEGGRMAAGRIRRLSEGAHRAAFDGEKISLPLYVRGLKMGDRVRPFGLEVDKKVKEILIDRKVPRDERWGRPVVCDAQGKILWIPGVLRSSHAPVTRETRRTIVLRAEVQGRGPRKD